MTRRELNLAIFEGTADRPLWQPRLDEWINYNRVRGTLPAPYADMDEFQIYDHLRCSTRYQAHAGLEGTREEGAVEVWDEPGDANHILTHMRTRSGTITSVRQIVREGERIVNDRIREFPVKTPEDLRVATDIIEAEGRKANPEAFAAAAARMGDRGEPTVFFGSSGFTDLIKGWCGLLGTYYLLADARGAIEEHLEACDRRDDRIMEAALQLPCRIFNFGDHTTNEFTPPPILQRYCLPRWQRLSRIMTENGRYVHSHWDGNSRTILPYLQESGLHGVEALPPLPMGDMTLEEIKAAVGDKLVVLDLIPTTLFLEHYSLQQCLDFTKRIMEMFTPRLILGVSDEISGVGKIERIEAISELVDELYGLAD
jgi:hypothetical protein